MNNIFTSYDDKLESDSIYILKKSELYQEYLLSQNRLESTWNKKKEEIYNIFQTKKLNLDLKIEDLIYLKSNKSIINNQKEQNKKALIYYKSNYTKAIKRAYEQYKVLYVRLQNSYDLKIKELKALYINPQKVYKVKEDKLKNTFNTKNKLLNKKYQHLKKVIHVFNNKKDNIIKKLKSEQDSIKKDKIYISREKENIIIDKNNLNILLNDYENRVKSYENKKNNELNFIKKEKDELFKLRLHLESELSKIKDSYSKEVLYSNEYINALELFNLQDNFTIYELKNSYKKLMKLYHPDTVQSTYIKKEYNKKTVIINYYYDFLKKEVI